MLKIVAIMLGGVFVGYLFRAKKLSWISKAITVAIWMLLFALGVVVGNNEMILNHLDTLGVQALVLTLGAVSGSLILAKIVYHFFFKKTGI